MNLCIYSSQVSGKGLKLVDKNDLSILFKGYSESQATFYKKINELTNSNSGYQVKDFIPKYFGQFTLQETPNISQAQHKHSKISSWLDHLKGRYKIRNKQNKFIKLENLTYNYQKPNVIDIKLGTRYTKIQRSKQFADLYNVELNGCNINFPNSDKVIFMNKYYCHQLKKLDQIILCLALFFFDGKHILISLLFCIIDKLKDLFLCLNRLQGCSMYSSSVCIFYDAMCPQKNLIKLLDFDRIRFNAVNESQNQKTCHGILSMIQFLTKIYQNRQQVQLEINQKIQNFIINTGDFIPQIKFIKYRND